MNDFRLVGLMQIGGSNIKLRAGLRQLTELCDATVVLLDNVSPPLDLIKMQLDVDEICAIRHILKWHEQGNHLAMLARATAHGATHVIHIDADEEFAPGLTREIINSQIAECEAHGASYIFYPIREMWNETHFRSDGHFGRKCRITIRKNMFRSCTVEFGDSYHMRHHGVPVPPGATSISANTPILHFGMSTPKLRAARLKKWQELDPDRLYQPMGYSYMADETGLTLKPIERNVAA